ncbi:hypothetical protein V5E97_35730 [Singulisphaera sp. Ch08]|uniref:Uncharacterized protein n=1 Tax=Singulisphaera sp. Ch08 TaxID=3120278 RepID=A0AAU7CEU6_9BACT
MPLRLNVGVSKKLGLPEYSSIGASCNLELELESGLLQNDLDGLHAQIRGAYVAANQAVNDELNRLQALPVRPSLTAEVTTSGNGHSNGTVVHTNGTPTRRNGVHARASKPATTGQVKAIYAIARAQRADLEGLLRDEYAVDRPEDLSLADASKMIDQLKVAGAI